MTKNKKFILGIAIGVMVLGIGTYIGLWVQAHQFDWTTPIHFQSPLKITKKEIVQNITIIQQVQADNLPLNENEKYLCQVFGQQCKNALVIQHAENGTEQCDRFHVNDNGSIDVGFMQINSVHLKNGVTLSDLVDCKKNIDIAYQIYQGSGWSAWSTSKGLGIK